MQASIPRKAHRSKLLDGTTFAIHTNLAEAAKVGIGELCWSEREVRPYFDETIYRAVQIVQHGHMKKCLDFVYNQPTIRPVAIWITVIVRFTTGCIRVHLDCLRFLHFSGVVSWSKYPVRGSFSFGLKLTHPRSLGINRDLFDLCWNAHEVLQQAHDRQDGIRRVLQPLHNRLYDPLVMSRTQKKHAPHLHQHNWSLTKEERKVRATNSVP